MKIKGNNLVKVVRGMTRIIGNEPHRTVTMTAHKNGLMVKASGDAIISATLPCLEPPSKKMEATVLASVLVSTLANRKDVELTLTSQGLVAKSGRYMSTIPLMEKPAEMSADKKGEALPGNFLAHVGEALESMSINNIVPQTPVMQLCCQMNAKIMMMSVLDSVHAATYIAKSDHDARQEFSVPLPAIDGVLKMLDELDGMSTSIVMKEDGMNEGESVGVRKALLTPSFLWISSSTASAGIPLSQMPANYPRVVDMVRAFLGMRTKEVQLKQVGTLTIGIDKLLALISNASMAENTNSVVLTPDANKVKARIEWHHGKIQDVFQAKMEGEPPQIGLGIMTMADILKMIGKASKTVSMHVRALSIKSSSSQTTVFISTKKNTARIIYIVATMQSSK